ncbi:MAG: phosphotransferase family protein, partial [Chloroflexota bacterium]
AAGVGTLSTHELVRETWEQARGLALARLSPSDGAMLTRLIERFLADDANFAGPSRLLYADFAPEHILYDQASQRIAGIIDWGDLAIGDPDYDLTYLYQDYGAPFVQRLLTYLPHPDPARLFAKLGVFSATDYLHDLAQAQADTTVDDLTETLDGLRDVLTGPD